MTTQRYQTTAHIKNKPEAVLAFIADVRNWMRLPALAQVAHRHQGRAGRRWDHLEMEVRRPGPRVRGHGPQRQVRAGQGVLVRDGGRLAEYLGLPRRARRRRHQDVGGSGVPNPGRAAGQAAAGAGDRLPEESGRRDGHKQLEGDTGVLGFRADKRRLLQRQVDQPVRQGIDTGRAVPTDRGQHGPGPRPTAATADMLLPRPGHTGGRSAVSRQSHTRL